MSKTESELQRAGCLISARVPLELFHEIERDASDLGVSLSDAARIRLRTGHVPSLKKKEQADV